MKKQIFAALIGGFIGGAASGSLITYFYMKDKCEEYIESEINDYIDSLEEKSDNEEGEDAEEESLINPGDWKAHEEAIPKVSTAEEERIKYERFYDKSVTYKEKTPVEILRESEHPEDSDEDGVPADEEDMGSDEAFMDGLIDSQEHAKYVQVGTPPYKITGSEFDDLNGLDKERLYYWTQDGAYSDENDDQYEDIYIAIGDVAHDSGWLDRIEDDPDSDEILFVRNLTLGRDYALEAVNGALRDQR